MQLKRIGEAGLVMNQVTQKTEQGNTDVPGSGVAAPDTTSPSRRRLIKLGAAAVPVVATLASRPALAWHCQSTSAWGSTMVGTSLQHTDTTSFETWYISDWKDNILRSSAGSRKPWLYVRPKLSQANQTACLTNGSFDYTKVTCAMLTADLGINCAGASGKVRDVLTSGTDLRKATIVAQLNLKLTPNSTYRGVMSSCLGSTTALNEMANNQYYQPSTRKWTTGEIVDYLKNNWIAQ